MSNVRSLIANSSKEQLREASAFLKQWAGRSEVIVLAPSRGAADDFLRSHASAGLAGVHSMTLGHLAASLAGWAMAQRGLAPMSRLSQEALAARATFEVRKQGKLCYFEPVADTPGFVRALASTLTELRMDAVNLDQLRKAGLPGQDLAELLAFYAALLDEQALADQAIVLELAVAAAAQPHRYLDLPMLMIDVPVRRVWEQRLIEAVGKRSPAWMATLLAADVESQSSFGVKPETLTEATGRTLDRVRKYLFASQLPEPQPFDDSVEYFSAPGEGLECVEIARRIRKFAADGMRFDQMAILLRSPERYQPLVEEALRRAGAPAYFHRGTARPDPGGRAFLALLACTLEGLTATRFAEYLSLAQVPNLNDDGAPIESEPQWVPSQDEVLANFSMAGEAVAFEAVADATAPVIRSPAGWERLIVDASVVGGRERWARRLRGLEEEQRMQIASLETDDEDRPRLERKLAQLEGLAHFALPLIDLLAALPTAACWGEWVDQLATLATRSLRRPESVMAMLGELEPMREVGPVALLEVYGVLSERLRFLRNEPPRRRYGAVFVATPEEARGREFAVVFLPGLAEGVFPKKAMEDPLLLDTHRVTAGGHLTRQDDRVARERLLLHCAAAAGEKLVVSYPRMDATQGRPRVPSFYALEVLRAGEGRLPDLRVFEKQAANNAEIRLGRPAPLDPRAALDDAEYDVARLNLVTSNESKGFMRYLVEVSPVLARSLRTRYRRWGSKWSGADGLVDPEVETLKALEAHWLDRRSYSPTALQHFAACPYKFLLSAIHQLRPREETVPLEQMDPLTRGALFHEAQELIWKEMEPAGLLPLKRSDLQKAMDIGDGVLNAVAADYAEKLAPAIERVWNSEVEDLRTDLRGWLRHVSGDAGWKLVATEFSFGLRDSIQPEAFLLDALKLRGSVDLVEESIADGTLRITDHKTGKPPEQTPAYVGGGTVLQPTLYALAMEQLLGKPVASSRLSYCTQRGQYREVKIPIQDHARQRIAQVVDVIAAAVHSGFLPAAPKKDACEYCDYRPVCGPYEEQRAGKKQQARVEDLVEMRRLP